MKTNEFNTVKGHPFCNEKKKGAISVVRDNLIEFKYFTASELEKLAIGKLIWSVLSECKSILFLSTMYVYRLFLSYNVKWSKTNVKFYWKEMKQTLF